MSQGYQNLDSNPFDDDDIQPDVVYNPPSEPQTQYTAPSARQKQKFEGGLFTLNHYRQYFDLTTAEFFHNCLYSINPIVRLTDDEIDSVGDLYGAIWITGTIIFLLFFSNTLADLIGEWIKHKYNPDANYFQLLLFSINLLYGYIIVVPVILYAVLRFYLKVPRLIHCSRLISIYGYSNLSWIPAAFLSILRGFLANHSTLSTILRWVLIAIGGLFSGLNIVWKINSYLSATLEGNKEKYTLLVFLGLVHAGFMIAVKVSFFGALY